MKDTIAQTIHNNAYLMQCECPQCGNTIPRGNEERDFFCEKCGTHLRQRAFTDEECSRAAFDRKTDTYED